MPGLPRRYLSMNGAVHLVLDPTNQGSADSWFSLSCDETSRWLLPYNVRTGKAVITCLACIAAT